MGSHHSGSHCEPAAGTDHRAWPGQDSGLSARGQWDEGSKPRSWLLAPAAGSGQLAPGSEAQSCVEDRTEQPGLAEEGTEDDRNHIKYKHRNQTELATVKTTASTHCVMWGSACHCTQTCSASYQSQK